MKNFKKVELKCLKINNLGQGIAVLDKKEIVVPYFLPKEVGLVEVEKGSSKGKLVKLLKPSSIRYNTECGVFQKCGSCHLLHMKYLEQLNLKKSWVEDCFKKEKINATFKEIISAESQKGYRNKMQVAYKMRDNKLVYGFYEEDSHRVIPLEKCLVQTDKQNDICKEILVSVLCCGDLFLFVKLLKQIKY